MDHEQYAIGTAGAAAAIGNGSVIGAVALAIPVTRIRALEQGGPGRRPGSRGRSS